EFRDLVFGIADASGFARERVVLGGDHLGPNRWQRQSASAAMANAEVLIAAYVEAGYTKIHLDCSMACPDDPTVLTDEIVAGRAARLLRGPRTLPIAKAPTARCMSSAPRCRYPAERTRR